jgi:hypothetical protein
MAQETGTFSTYDSIGNREELADVIENISPKDTPFLSMIGKKKVATKHPEWQTDALNAPNASNAQIEGYEYAYAAHTPTVRVGTFTQISDKTVMTTKTEEVIDKAGRKSELAYQMTKRSAELKKDMEAIALSNQASVAGSDAAARLTAGLPAWIETNALRGASGADGGFNSGTGLVDAATNGTQRAFTKALLDTLLTDCYTTGADVDLIMVSPYNKRVFSSFMSDANVAAQRTQTKGDAQARIIGAADYYVSDFGTVAVVPNRVMAASAALARNVFAIDTEYLTKGVLRDFAQHTPAETGDNEKKVINTEWCLVVKNEAAVGVIADTFGLTAST